MQRRTFLQGTAATLAAASFASARVRARDDRPLSPPPGTRTIIYNDQAELLNQRGFNPLTYPPDRLPEFGIPRRPPDTSPLYPIWRRIFVPPFFYRLQAVQEFLVIAGDIEPRLQVAAPLLSRFETSRNWSGAYISPSRGNMLVEVAGGWTVPSVQLPTGLTAADTPMSSTWVGLDGQRRYLNSTLPQIGTRQGYDDPNDTAPEYSAWWQWWEQGQTNAKPNKIAIKLDVGDDVFCGVQVQPGGTASAIVYIANFGSTAHPKLTQFWSKSVTPKNKIPNLVVSGATAEWIVERPTKVHRTTLLPLVDFDPVQFTSCYALGALDPNAASAGLGSYQNLNGARFIRMYERLANPARSHFLSMPTRLVPDASDAFLVTYSGP